MENIELAPHRGNVTRLRKKEELRAGQKVIYYSGY